MGESAQPLELVPGKEGPVIEVRGTEITKQKPPDADALLRQVNELGEGLRLVIVAAKRLPREQAFEPHQEPSRSLALAQAHLQTGFMWLRRALESPKIF